MNKPKTTGILFTVFFYIIIVAMIAGSTLFAISDNENKSIFSYRFYTVLSDSMRPEFAKGDMIIIKMVALSDIEIGDIVTFNPGSARNAYLTHRVVWVDENYIITRGDTNGTDDPPTPAERIIGKYIFSVPFAGSVIKFIQDNFIPMIVVIAGSFFLTLVLKSYFGKNKPRVRRRNRRLKFK